MAIFNKSDEDIQRIVHEKYKKEHLVDGQKGAARFTAANILKTNPGEKKYICSYRSVPWKWEVFTRTWVRCNKSWYGWAIEKGF